MMTVRAFFFSVDKSEACTGTEYLKFVFDAPFQRVVRCVFVEPKKPANADIK